MTETSDNPARPGRTPLQTAGLWGGLIAALLLQLIGPPDSLLDLAGGDAGAAREGWIVLSLLAVMAAWWVTEAIPIPATALLPMIVLPFFNVFSMRDAAAPYMHPIVVLLLGGFIIAKAVERWGLHRRIALTVVARAGARPVALVGGFMVAAAGLSMWISNTATAIMMTPIALSVAAAIAAEDDREDETLAVALLLGVAYACSIGGLGTPIGTPTNLIIISYLEDETGRVVDFVDWMALGLPVVVAMIALGWFVLTRLAFRLERHGGRAGGEVVRGQLAALGAITDPEKRVLAVLATAAGLWMFRRPLSEATVFGVAPFAGLTDHVTAIFASVLLFLIPAGGRGGGGALLDWRTAEGIPWGVVILFGGGMSLAAAISGTLLSAWIGAQLAALSVLPIFVLIVVLTTVVIFTTEVTSNIATASALMPVLGAMAAATGIDVALLAAPLAMAASCAFMLPMATGPNAVVFASGEVSMGQMMRAGVRLNLLGVPVISVFVYLLAGRALPLS